MMIFASPKIPLAISFFWLIVAIIENSFLMLLSYNDDDLYLLAILVALNFSAQTFTLYGFKIRLVSFFYAFLAFLYVFHFGQLMTYSLFNETEFDYSNYITAYVERPEIMWKALRVSLFVMNGIFIGGLLAFRKKTIIFTNEKIEAKSNWSVIKSYGLTLLLISFPFRIYLDVMNFFVSSALGYGATDKVSIGSGVFSAVANFWYLAILLYYFAVKDKYKQYYCIICVVYMFLTMLSGHRGHQIISIVSLAIVYIIDNNVKFNLKRTTLGLLLSLVILSFLDIIFAIRGSGFDYLYNHFQDVINESTKNNIILETLNDFGGTIYTPYLVIDGYGRVFSPFFGECFLKSFVQIIPDIGGTFKEINISSIYPKMLNTNHMIGGSFVGEMYYNFGEFYWLFPFFFGSVMGKFSQKIELAIMNKRYNQICLYLPFLSYSLWWVRDAVGNFTRPVVWLLLIYYVVSNLSREKVFR